MIEWQDDALVLAARRHGETSAVLQLLTREHGRHAGLLRGAFSQRHRGLLEPGNQVTAKWQARLADHLGTYSCELAAAHSARLLDDPERLAALSAAAAICEEALPEREAHPACYDAFLALIEALEGPHWAETYVRWELGILGELGFGLDLSHCAAGGDNSQLAYVSPRSGRAVSLAAAAPYRERLLALPGFLAGGGEGGREEVAQGLRLTGYFFERHIFNPRERQLPAARLRLQERFPLLEGDA